MCYLIQSQTGVNYGNTISHQDVKRQSENDCQCKDGAPGPAGEKGQPGEPGKKGRRGQKGPQGLLIGMGNSSNNYL